MGKKVSREAAIQALITTPQIKQAAAISGVSEKTLHVWLKEPEFAQQLQDAQRAISKQVTRSVISKAVRATEVLDEVMSDAENPPNARVTAARTLLDSAFRAIETEDILTRLEALENEGSE